MQIVDRDGFMMFFNCGAILLMLMWGRLKDPGLLVLAGLLFIPASKLIWVMSVRRLQRKTGHELNDSEIQGQKNRARIIALVLVAVFSWFFNLNLLGVTHG